MKFIDLAKEQQLIRSEIDTAISKVLEHGIYIMGPEVHELEAKLAEYVGVKHCITMSSGTTALQVALMVLGVGPGDEVITTPFSFFATVEVIQLLGATPVFVDIDPKTYNLDTELLEAAISLKTKAIMPVNLYGQCADYDAINQIAERHGLAVIEDAAQSFGAEYKGKRSCGLTTISCTSFFPSKPLGCYGDGGACFTDDDQLAARMRRVIDHGQAGRYQHVEIGINGRFDSIQAAILSVKFDKLFDQQIKSRQHVASLYQQYLGNGVMTPYVEPHNLSAFAQYTIQVDQRDQVQAQLKQQGIPTAVHYPKPLHQQDALRDLFLQQSFPVAEHAASRVLSLPFHPYLEESEIEKVASAVNQVVCAEVERV